MQIDELRHLMLKQRSEIEWEILDLKRAIHSHDLVTEFLQLKLNTLKEKLLKIKEELTNTKKADFVVTKGEIDENI